ncbi:cytochrome b [Lachnellula subtilissima]|uniref:Cytochrome b n=1 Tax=Lachnellula subtilissima TaxID=602034 RepID=A0A8H8RBP0_9HELO|nr:cytochrome b [Lachnellula subtilissima]
MRIFKSHPLLKLVNSYLIDSPQPSNLSVTLAMHYNPSVLEAFNSVEHIMRDVNNASAFFFIVYLHIGRGLYYGSYRAPRTLLQRSWVMFYLMGKCLYEVPQFFALHFVLPFVLAALVLMHLIALHDSAGSGNPLGISANYDRLPFAPYFLFKDLITIFIFIIVLSIFVFFMPNVLGDSDNYVMANPMQTPPSIVPE